MSAIILFDGVCNFCNGSVNFIIERDPEAYFKFAPLQSEIGQKLLSEHHIDKTQTDSVVLIENGKAFRTNNRRFKNRPQIERRVALFLRIFHRAVVRQRRFLQAVRQISL